MFITSTPPGADVLLDGESKGLTPLTIRELEPGEYEVVLRKGGYQAAQIIATVKMRQITNVAAALRDERKPITHRLAFVSNRDDGFDIWTSDENGYGLARWTTARWPRSPIHALLAPDSSSFSLNFESVKGVATVLVTAPRPNGDNPAPELRAVGGDIFRALQWAPDGRSLLLKNLISQTIWVANSLGNVTPVLIPDAPHGVLTATFAPEPGFIAYADYDQTYRIALDGTRREELAANGKEGNAFLRFSRDGRRLAHVQLQRLNPYNAGELWLMNANGNLPRRLTIGGSQDFDPVWSRDNQRIVFVHRENVDDAQADLEPARLESNLFVFDFATQQIRALTNFRNKRVRQPSISFDDQRITFVCNETGSDEIWVVDFYGGDPYPLTHDNATATFPLWLW
ncbi:MAG: PEGA domain-containing protein [Chloroflexota bacterium]